jgi:branched-chain amino acid transport system substrate-binding protein
LDDYPDESLFFRTIPSDSLQIKAIADLAAQTGTQQVTIVYADDAYGQSLAKSVEEALEGRPIVVVDTIPFSARDEDLGETATRVTQSGAAVTIVLADSNDGTRFLETLGQFDTGGLDAVIVNDAMRNPSNAQRIEALDVSLRSIVIGVAPQAEPALEDDAFDSPGAFAANAFDCVNLIALAAAQADSDAPRAIALQMASVSTIGSSCRDYAACILGLEAGLQIDYDGPSGVTELQARTGDPGRAVFDLFGFDDSGRDQLLGPLTVSY